MISNGDAVTGRFRRAWAIVQAHMSHQLSAISYQPSAFIANSAGEPKLKADS
jgi:hypothetical protein